MSYVQKFALNRSLRGPFEVTLPAGCEVIAISSMQGVPHLWAKVPDEDSGDAALFEFLAVRDGDPIPDDIEVVYLTSMYHGTTIIHIFFIGQEGA